MRPQCVSEDRLVESDPARVSGERVAEAPARQSPWTPRSALAVLLLVLSWVLWLAAPVAPFLPLSVVRRTSLVAAALVAAEVTFWLGLVLLGPDLAETWKKWFPSGWWRMLWRAGTRPRRGQAGQ